MRLKVHHLMAAFFIALLAYLSHMVWEIPLHFVDLPAHILRVLYVDKGIPIFLTPLVPVWYLIADDLYKLSGDVLLATYASILLVYSAGVLLVFCWAKELKTSPWALLMTIANPLIAVWLLLFGRMPETVSWMAMLLLLYLSTKYWSRRGRGLMLMAFVPPLLSHYGALLLAPFLIIPLVLKHMFGRLEGDCGRWLLIESLLIGLILFAAYTGLTNYLVLPDTPLEKVSTLDSLLAEGWAVRKLIAFIAPLFFLTTVRFVGEEKWLFAPSYALALLLLTRVLAFIPYFNMVHSTIYSAYFLMLAFYLHASRQKYDILYTIACILLLIGGIGYSTRFTFRLTPEEQQWANKMPGLSETHPLHMHWYMQIKYGLTDYCHPIWPKGSQFTNPEPVHCLEQGTCWRCD